jgi:hypothetical protein
MFTNWDARDVGSLEEVFRSHEFGQATNTMVGRGASYPARREDGLFAREFGRPLTAVHSHDVDGEGEPRPWPRGGGPEAARVEKPEVPEQRPQVEPSGGPAALGAEHAEAPSTAPSNRHATRYGKIASVGALGALVAAGIMAGVGAGHHLRSSVSAQGEHNRARPQRGFHTTPGVASSGSAAPSRSLTAAAGSGGKSSGTAAHGGLAPGNAPGGQVTLVGPATFTGTPAPPAASGSSPGVGNGATGSPSPPGNVAPVAPVAPNVGSTVSAVGSTVATSAGQLGSSVPEAASTVGAVNSVVNTLDQTVSASTE